jgi:hypothetical protein
MRLARSALNLSFYALAIFAANAHAAPPPAGTLMRVTATATFVPAGLTQSATISSNVVTATVATVEAAVLTQSQTVTRPPAATVVLSHVLTNTGNIASTYTMALVNRGPNCPASSLELGGLQLWRDSSNNGVQDPGDESIAINRPAALTLVPGQSVELLVRGTLPITAAGQACASLTATTGLNNIVVSNEDIITVGSGAILLLSKSAAFSGALIQSQSKIN